MFDEIRDLLAEAELQMERVIILGLLEAELPDFLVGDFRELMEDHTNDELAAMFDLPLELFTPEGEDCADFYEAAWAILSRRSGYLLEMMRPVPQHIMFDACGEVSSYMLEGIYKKIFAYGDTLADAVAQAIRKSEQVYDEVVARAREAKGAHV